jgi:hypothetical protein
MIFEWRTCRFAPGRATPYQIHPQPSSPLATKLRRAAASITVVEKDRATR